MLHIVDVFMYQEMENKPAYTVIDEMKNNIETEQSTRWAIQFDWGIWVACIVIDLAFSIIILVMWLYHDVFICLDPSGQ